MCEALKWYLDQFSHSRRAREREQQTNQQTTDHGTLCVDTGKYH